MYRAAGYLVVVAFLLSRPALAQGPGWETSFAPNAVSSWMTGNKPRVLVAGAGEASVLGDVEKYFVAALRDGGRTTLVMTDEVLGDVAGLTDPEIVKKASSFPVDQVAVLRVFPSGDTPTAVVTFYGLDGKVLSALTAQRGTSLAEKTSSNVTGRGVSSEAAAAVTEVTRSVPSASDAEEEYEKSYIGFDEIAVVNTHRGTVASVSTQTLAYQGKYKKPLHGANFYETVGRPDLVAKYIQRNTVKTVLFVGAGATVLAGAAIAVVPLIVDPCDRRSDYSEFSACVDRKFTGGFVGAGTIFAGTGLFFAGSLYNAHPVSPSEARELADAYNKGLRTRLNLGADNSKPQTAQKDFTLSIAPAFGLHGGGLALRGTF